MVGSAPDSGKRKSNSALVAMLSSRLFLICFVANLAQGTSFGLFLHFPGFLTGAGASESIIGLIIAAGAVTSILASPFVGNALDTRGRRQIIQVGCALTVLLSGAFLFFEHVSLFLVLVWMAHSAVETLLNVAFFTYATDVVPKENRSQGIALFGVSAIGSVGAGALLGDIAFEYGGYDGVFIAAIVLAAIAGLLSLRLTETHRPQTSTEEDTTKANGTGAQNWFALIIDRDLVSIWLVAGAFFFSMVGVFVYLKTFVLETGVGSIGLYFAIYTSTAILLRVFFGDLPDRIGPARFAAPVILIYALGFLVLAGTNHVAMLMFAALLGGIGHGYGYPVLLALATDRAGPARTGTAVSIYGAVDDGAALVAAPALGLLIDGAGYTAMYLAITAGLMAAAALYWLRDGRLR